MNQILETMKSKTKFRKVYKIQLIISVIILIFLVVFCIYYIISLNSKENLSNSILSSYSIYRLYSNLDNGKNLNDNNIFGIIKIPKINIEYSVFSNLTEDQLKISPCKFFGENLENFGNICIAGHNYDNSLFFSNIKLLKQNDEIYCNYALRRVHQQLCTVTVFGNLSVFGRFKKAQSGGRNERCRNFCNAYRNSRYMAHTNISS